MEFLNWIKEKIFGKTKAIEAPKEINTSSPEKFRKECAKTGQMSDEQRESMAIETERKRQIRLVGYNVLSNNYNMSNEDIKRVLYNELNNSQTKEEPIQVVLSDLDIAAIKDIHNTVQKNPELITYLNKTDVQTRDNNILLVIQRMEEASIKQAKEYGYNEQEAIQFIGTTSNRIISQLQEEQARHFDGMQQE